MLMPGRKLVRCIASVVLVAVLIAQVGAAESFNAQEPFLYTPEEIRSHLISAIEGTSSHRTVTRQIHPALHITTETLVVRDTGIRFADSTGFASYCIEENELVYTQTGDAWTARHNGGPCVDYWLERLTTTFWEAGGGWQLIEATFAEGGAAIVLVFTLGDPGSERADAVYWINAATFLPELSTSTSYSNDNDFVQYETEYLDWNAPLTFQLPAEALIAGASPVPS